MIAWIIVLNLKEKGESTNCLYIQNAYKIPRRPNIFRRRRICEKCFKQKLWGLKQSNGDICFNF